MARVVVPEVEHMVIEILHIEQGERSSHFRKNAVQTWRGEGGGIGVMNVIILDGAARRIGINPLVFSSQHRRVILTIFTLIVLVLALALTCALCGHIVLVILILVVVLLSHYNSLSFFFLLLFLFSYLYDGELTFLVVGALFASVPLLHVFHPQQIGLERELSVKGNGLPQTLPSVRVAGSGLVVIVVVAVVENMEEVVRI